MKTHLKAATRFGSSTQEFYETDLELSVNRYARNPQIILKTATDDRVEIRVDAEDLLRSVRAAWEMVRSLEPVE